MVGLKNRKFKDWKKDIIQHKKIILIALICLVLSLALYSIAGNYVDKNINTPATDIILDNLPTVNFSWLYSYGFIIVLGVLLLHPLIWKPKDFHAAMIQFSLLLLIRSFFITLTHLKVPSDAILVPFRVDGWLAFKNDLFFSGHTAVPFLGFLMFRKQGGISKFFIIATLVLATAVLLMHAHYSIDVFAAFFITYGSYQIGNVLLEKLHIWHSKNI